MSQFYHFLLFFEFIPLGLFAVCCFVDYNKTWNFYTRISIAVSMVILNIVQFILEIMLEYNYSWWTSVMMVFLWGMNLLSNYLYFKKRNFRQKYFSANFTKQKRGNLLVIAGFLFCRLCTYLENYFDPFFFESVSRKGQR